MSQPYIALHVRGFPQFHIGLAVGFYGGLLNVSNNWLLEFWNENTVDCSLNIVIGPGSHYTASWQTVVEPLHYLKLLNTHTKLVTLTYQAKTAFTGYLKSARKHNCDCLCVLSRFRAWRFESDYNLFVWQSAYLVFSLYRGGGEGVAYLNCCKILLSTLSCVYSPQSSQPYKHKKTQPCIWIHIEEAVSCFS